MRHTVLVLALLSACSSTAGDAATVSADQGCSELAQAFCDKASTCSTLYTSLLYGDVAGCTARIKANCLVGLAAPSTAASPGDTAACASAAKAGTCANLFDNDLPAACLPKSGGLDDGKNCTTDSQCKSAFCALDQDKAVCGVCAAKPAAGGKCVSKACPAPMKCSSDGTCNKPVAVGAACSASIPCAQGGTCFGMKCVADAATEGAACDGMAGPNCDAAKGLFCVSKKCVKVNAAAAGAECGFDVDTASMMVKGATLCGKGGWCSGVDVAKGVTKGKCEPAAADGAACVEGADPFNGKGPGCLEPARCVSGKCVIADNTTCK